MRMFSFGMIGDTRAECRHAAQGRRSYNRLAVTQALRIAPTEKRNPRTRDLDRKSTEELLRILNREDARVARAVAKEIPAIARAVNRIAAALARGGRLIYVGAGTSGRLGVLDAAECPPTFGVSPATVQGVLAGGAKAFAGAVEGAEDSPRQGARDLAARGLGRKDVVVGLSASGRTPYVLGAIEHARRRGAATVAVTVAPRSPLARRAELAIVPRVGPEAIAGSTRLKAGTAQKLVLNMLSTAAMVRLGCVYDNWMIRAVLANRKLRRRGLRVLAEAAGARPAAARRALARAGNSLPIALVALKAGVDAAEARRRLAKAGGNLRRALGEKTRPGRRSKDAHG
jgi:N-acetylmuramic acid 6-phosphate etherase